MYYTALLNAIPIDWVNIPIILHCMVEQVAYYDCSIEDMEALEVNKSNRRLAKGFDASIQRFGHSLSCMRRSSDLLNEIIEEIKAKQAEEDMQTIEEMLKNFLKIASDKANQRLEEVEKLIAEAAAKLAEEEAIKDVVIAIGEQKSLLEKRKSSKMASNLKLLQESAKNGKSLKEGKKSLAIGSKSLTDGKKPSKAGIKKASQKGSSITQPYSKSSPQSAQSSTVTVSWDPAAAEISELLKDSLTRKEEELSLVVHEFSRVGRLERIVKQKALEFLESVDIIEVEKRMLSLLAYPGNCSYISYHLYKIQLQWLTSL
jgi:hypothetical protein